MKQFLSRRSAAAENDLIPIFVAFFRDLLARGGDIPGDCPRVFRPAHLQAQIQSFFGSTDTWVSFKVFGVMPLTFVFAMLQYPVLTKHQLPENDEST